MSNNPQNISRNSHAFKAIKEILAKVLPQGSEAWLYGSRARGDARTDSDWDVLVLLNKSKITIDDDMNITMPLKMVGYDYNQEINPQLFTFKEWDSYSFTTFNHNVIHDRIRIA